MVNVSQSQYACGQRELGELWMDQDGHSVVQKVPRAHLFLSTTRGRESVPHVSVFFKCQKPSLAYKLKHCLSGLSLPTGYTAAQNWGWILHQEYWPHSPPVDQSVFLLFQNMIEECDTAAVTSLIQSHLPEAYLKEDIGGELVYVLPPFKSTVSGAYQALLRALDTSLSDLHLGCYGISNTTVEEVWAQDSIKWNVYWD